MTKKYDALQAFPLKSGSSFVRPVQTLPERVKLNDPAIDVMTDLNKVSVVGVRAKTSMERANAKMIRYGVRMLLVLDDNEQMAGLLTATDVMGEKPMRFLQSMGGTHADILVRDIMTPEQRLEVISMDDVLHAHVGHVVATLKSKGRQHAAVVDALELRDRIRYQYALQSHLHVGVTAFADPAEEVLA